MIRRSTERFPVAVFTVLAGGILAVLVGRPAAAVLVAPWFIVLLLAVSVSDEAKVKLEASVDNSRAIVGDMVDVIVGISPGRGRIKVQSHPATWFGTTRTIKPDRAADTILKPDDDSRLALSFVAPEWGTFDAGRLSVELTEPYGLFRWSGMASSPVAVRVHPSAQTVKQMVAPWIVRRTTGAHHSRAIGRGVEYADLRHFQAGDSLRDINWRVSARSPELWVSERHPDRATDVVLLLDSFVESGHDVHAVVGMAIEAAVALAESHLAVTDRVGLVEFGGLVRWVAPGTGRLQLQRLVDALLSTGLYANAAERDLALIAPKALPPRSFLVAMSPLLDDRFIQALGELAGRGHDVAVIECDPSIRPPAQDNTADGPSAPFLAWRIWQAERSILRDRLAKHGIAVAQWKRQDPLEGTLLELGRRRRRIRPGVRH